MTSKYYDTANKTSVNIVLSSHALMFCSYQIPSNLPEIKYKLPHVNLDRYEYEDGDVACQRGVDSELVVHDSKARNEECPETQQNTSVCHKLKDFQGYEIMKAAYNNGTLFIVKSEADFNNCLIGVVALNMRFGFVY